MLAACTRRLTWTLLDKNHQLTDGGNLSVLATQLHVKKATQLFAENRSVATDKHWCDSHGAQTFDCTWNKIPNSWRNNLCKRFLGDTANSRRCAIFVPVIQQSAHSNTQQCVSLCTCACQGINVVFFLRWWHNATGLAAQRWDSLGKFWRPPAGGCSGACLTSLQSEGFPERLYRRKEFPALQEVTREAGFPPRQRAATFLNTSTALLPAGGAWGTCFPSFSALLHHQQQLRWRCRRTCSWADKVPSSCICSVRRLAAAPTCICSSRSSGRSSWDPGRERPRRCSAKDTEVEALVSRQPPLQPPCNWHAVLQCWPTTEPQAAERSQIM